ncbi:hypothetical protein BDR03DRAFT_1010022 [Suillus americanus]|nr:hypothetical protein BDR03DRAFT_1010022 [Suillus americanus]
MTVYEAAPAASATGSNVNADRGPPMALPAPFGRDLTQEGVHSVNHHCVVLILHSIHSKTKPKPKAPPTSKTQTKRLISRAARNNNSTGITKQIFKEIADSSIKIIIAGSSVSDLAPHYLNRFNIAILKVPFKFDRRRVARVVDTTPCPHRRMHPKS